MPDREQSAASRRGWRGVRIPWGLVFVGLALGVAAALFFRLREPSEALTADRLAAARATWSARAPSDYALEIEIEGAMEGRHRVVVEGGKVVGMTTGGAEASRSAWGFWSVDGLFSMLETELANAERPRESYGVASGAVVLRARFDARWGYPEFFLRHVMGSRQGIEWRVIGFEPAAR